MTIFNLHDSEISTRYFDFGYVCFYIFVRQIYTYLIDTVIARTFTFQHKLQEHVRC
jgi:hypothetical protein